MIGLGTVINAITVIIGSSVGLLLNKHLPKTVINIIFQALGLFTIFIGIKMALDSTNLLVMVLSLVLGAIVGQLMNLELMLQKLSDKLKHSLGSDNRHFTQGLITAFLLFCMGSLTFIGAIEEGTKHDPTLLITKAIMDGFSSAALAAGLGSGVLFSVVPLVIYQGALTLLAALLGNFVPQIVITEISAAGGVLLIGLGIDILNIKRINVINLLPALLIVPLLLWLKSLFL